MDSYSTFEGMVVLETDNPHEEVTPDRAEALAAALLEAASDARRRVSCTEPRLADGMLVYGISAQSGTCACGEGIFLAEGADEWVHSRDLGKQLKGTAHGVTP